MLSLQKLHLLPKLKLPSKSCAAWGNLGGFPYLMRLVGYQPKPGLY